MLGAAQFFTCAFIATDPPPRTLVAGQLAVWNAGTILVAVGVPRGQHQARRGGSGAHRGRAGPVRVGAGVVEAPLAAACAVGAALVLRRASAACLGVGALLGVLVATATPWAHGSLLGAHLGL